MTQPLISFDHVTVTYGNHLALEDISLTIPQGDYLGVIGGNGSGKTTFLKTILGLVSPLQGHVLINGQPPDKAALAIGYVPQYTTGERTFPMTLAEVVATGLRRTGLQALRSLSADQKDLIQSQLVQLGLEDLKDRPVSQLSGGEFQRMLIARALAGQPDLLILDEPTANVDHKVKEDIYALLKERNQDMTILLVTHDLGAISSCVKHLACINRRLVYHGPPEINADILSRAFGYPLPATCDREASDD